jgi:hypothetical protein
MSCRKSRLTNGLESRFVSTNDKLPNPPKSRPPTREHEPGSFGAGWLRLARLPSVPLGSHRVPIALPVLRSGPALAKSVAPQDRLVWRGLASVGALAQCPIGFVWHGLASVGVASLDSIEREFGFARRDVGFARRDVGFARRDVGFARRECALIRSTCQGSGRDNAPKIIIRRATNHVPSSPSESSGRSDNPEAARSVAAQVF